MTILIISCMDMRLNNILEKSKGNDSDVIVLRNAGANILGMKSSIRGILNNKNITEIKLMPHNDCGAMKVVYNSIKNGAKTSDDINNKLISQFTDKSFNTLQDLEKLNYSIQEQVLKDIAPGAKISVEPIDLSNYHSEIKHDHSLAFTYMSKGNYNELCSKSKLELNNTYFIHLNNIEEAVPDIEIGIKNIGIKNLFFIAQDKSEYRGMLSDMYKLMMKDFVKGVEAKFIKL
ncbi:MAG: carbonic anhydrase [Candidatus Micrarchaeia archaeon]